MGFSITGIFKSIEGWFTSAKVKQVEEEIAAIMPLAVQYVTAIDSLLGGSKTLEAVLSVAEHYIIPLDSAALTSPTALNNALMNMAVTLVERAIAATKLTVNQQTVANNIVVSAVNVAVSLAH